MGEASIQCGSFQAIQVCPHQEICQVLVIFAVARTVLSRALALLTSFSIIGFPCSLMKYDAKSEERLRQRSITKKLYQRKALAARKANREFLASILVLDGAYLILLAMATSMATSLTPRCTRFAWASCPS